MPVTCQSCDQSPLTKGGVAQVEPVHPEDAKEQREGDSDIVVVPLSSSAVKEGDGGEVWEGEVWEGEVWGREGRKESGVKRGEGGREGGRGEECERWRGGEEIRV